MYVPLDELVDLADGAVARQTAQVGEQLGLLRLEQGLVLGALERLVPEGADVHTENFRGLDDATERPHEGAVDAHELLGRHGISLVEDAADLIVVALDGFDGGLELIGDIELVGIEEQQDAVCATGEPADNIREGILTADALLLAREDAGRIDEGDLLEDGGGDLHALEAVEEVHTEALNEDGRTTV